MQARSISSGGGTGPFHGVLGPRALVIKSVDLNEVEVRPQFSPEWPRARMMIAAASLTSYQNNHHDVTVFCSDDDDREGL
jgi:hypothetical protein